MQIGGSSPLRRDTGITITAAGLDHGINEVLVGPSIHDRIEKALKGKHQGLWKGRGNGTSHIQCQHKRYTHIPVAATIPG